MYSKMINNFGKIDNIVKKCVKIKIIKNKRNKRVIIDKIKNSYMNLKNELRTWIKRIWVCESDISKISII